MISEYILEQFPNEACGILNENNEFIPLRNISPDPEHKFQFDPLEYLQHNVTAVIHSHTFKPNKKFHEMIDPRWPSFPDMVNWIAQVNIPWHIYACNGIEVSNPLILDDLHIPPLLDRTFVHGYTDCYGAVRDWYRLHRGIFLKNYPRDWRWWKKGQDLYTENLADSGFVEITEREADVGDAVLMMYEADVINHAGVICGNNQLYHHRIGFKAGIEPLNKYYDSIVKYVRYTGTK